MSWHIPTLSSDSADDLVTQTFESETKRTFGLDCVRPTYYHKQDTYKMPQSWIHREN